MTRSLKGRTLINLSSDPVFQASPSQISIYPETNNGEASIRFNPGTLTNGIIGGTPWIIGKNVVGEMGNLDIATAITTKSAVISFTPMGEVVVPGTITAGAITFPGSTPLSNYDTYSQVVNFTVSGVPAGTTTLNITKVGNLVTLSLMGFRGKMTPRTATGSLLAIDAIPTKFKNSSLGIMTTTCLAGSEVGLVLVSGTGRIEIYSNSNRGGFNPTYAYSVGPISCSWITGEK